MLITAYSRQGLRDYQQDRLHCDETKNIYAVVDGMGGHPNGDLAAETVVNSLSEVNTPSFQEVADKIREAAFACYTAGDRRGAVATTAIIHDSKIEIAHVGDSRAYMISDGNHTLITTDHAGLWGGLTNCIGPISPQTMRIDQYTLDYKPGDILILTSDGINTARSTMPQLITEAVEQLEDPAKVLCDKAIELGSRDNCTAIVIEF